MIGIEFTTDGSWFALEEDSTGVLTRGTGAADHGPFQIVSSDDAPGLNPTIRLNWLGPEPLSIVLATWNPAVADGAGGLTRYAQAVVTQNPRALLLTTFASGGALSYSIFFPIP